jgi:hypothetical protein
MGHLGHYQWRFEYGAAIGSGPLWQLYSEGFAQWCEHSILGEESWHMNYDRGGQQWIQRCPEHRSWLAKEYLRYLDEERSTQPFFGSWLDIQDWSYTGYFLGHELIKRLLAKMSIEDTALLIPQENLLTIELSYIAQEAGG